MIKNTKFGKNLETIFYEDGKLSSGITVKSKICDFNLKVYGYVPMVNDVENLLFSLYDVTKDFTIGYGNIRLKRYQVSGRSNQNSKPSDIFLPIADSIEKSKGKILLNFYMRILNPEVNQIKLDVFQEELRKNGSSQRTLDPEEMFVTKNDETYYLPSNQDITFIRNNEVAIAQKFLCVCTYINPINGDFSKTLLAPDD